ncbi:hypothetical protein LINGRAHAP2_LOCUS33484 [Linum grandiflorum]
MFDKNYITRSMNLPSSKIIHSITLLRCWIPDEHRRSPPFVELRKALVSIFGVGKTAKNAKMII